METTENTQETPVEAAVAHQPEQSNQEQPQGQDVQQQTPVAESQDTASSAPQQLPPTPQQQPQQSQQPAQTLAQGQQVLTRDRYNRQSLGPSLNTTVKKARVLMVGAGGIGCELLKNLVLTGFGEIHIVDLDTIDLSNLNRQFLFRQEHIKKSKALVAKEAAGRFNPEVNIVAHHANIKDGEFTVSWFKQFSIVFNALDNLDARRHVNKMALAADIPLIESGTTGFNGQVQVIKKGVTACYDCSPKETPKSFPVCTIRSTPSQPIHCIVWGKSYLLNEIFGASEDQAAFDHSEDADNAKEIEELRRESDELKKIREATGTAEFPQLLFDKVFKKDIDRLRSVEDMWKTRKAPEPLTYESVSSQASEALAAKQSIAANDQAVWSLSENLAVFNDSLERLSKRILELKKAKDPSGPEPIITFDKDDEDTLDFVTASANIRSIVFGIEARSKFDVKQMAGNIIPAIATTNAIVAGLCVLESFKVLKGEFRQAKEVFLTPFAPARLLAPDRPREPNPDCPVCGVFNATITVDLSRATLNDVVEDFLKGQMGLGEREFVLNNDIGVIYDADETDNLPKKLTELGIKGGSFLTVIDDEDEDQFVNIVVNIEEGSLDAAEKPVKASFSEQPGIPKKPAKASKSIGATNGETNGNGKLVEAEVALSAGPQGTKRPNQEEDSQPLKKARISDDEVVDVVTVDDADGAIIIDDD